MNEVRERLESDLSRIEDADLGTDACKKIDHPRMLLVPNEFQALASSFGEELRVLRDLAAPGWDQKKRTGRVNVRRYLKSRDNPQRVFDRFNPGARNAVSLHLDVLIDQSGSMGPQGTRAGFMAWAIKRAVDQLGGSATCSIIAYSSTTKVVYGPDTRVPETHTKDSYTSGGTIAGKALQQALVHCHRSQARYKAVFVLTDGMWADRDNISSTVNRLHDKGVYTSLFFLTDRYGSQSSNGLQSVINVNDTSTIVSHVRNTVVEDIKRAIKL
jgi:hypothetical protein